MAMLDERQVSAAIGSTAYDASGQKIGTVEHFYLDDRTGAPSWVAVTTGLFGTRQSVVPALDATFADGGLRLPVNVSTVKSAPQLAGDHLSPDDEAELRRHYGTATDRTGTDETGTGTDRSGTDGTGTTLRGTDTSMAAGTTAGTSADAHRETTAPVAPAGGAGSPTVELPADAPRPPAATEDGTMVRSEEQLVVGTERVATTRARLVKYVVTEEVQITVPIRREEIRVEQVPVDSPDGDVADESLLSDQPATGAASGGLPGEIVLHTERPVVSVEVVPTERVRLRTEVVHGQETVTDQVQREQVVVDQDTAPHRPGSAQP
jgi:stress response protein YsnF